MDNFARPLALLLMISYIAFYKVSFKTIFNKLHSFMQSRWLAENKSISSELTKINLLRIMTGLILFHRTFYTMYYQYFIDPYSLKMLTSGTVLICAACIILGFLTPIAIWTLILFNIQFDLIMLTSTLGTDVLQIVLMILGFLPAGTQLSVDAILMKHRFIGLIIKPIYSFFGTPSLEKFSILKLLAILTYGMMCIYSVTVHFDDIAWLSGNANIFILTSSYLSRHYTFFREFGEQFPFFALKLSAFTIYGMIVWELLFIPMMFINKLTQYFVIYWGFLFLLVSAFCLQLGWLPYYEFVLWGLLFWQARMINPSSSKQFIIFYDDKCNLCDKSVFIISKLDLFNVINFKPLSSNTAFLAQHSITQESAYRYLYGMDVDHLTFYKGYNLYLELSKKLLILLPAYPVLVLGNIIKLGPLLYNAIASHRMKWFGACEIPSFKADNTHQYSNLSSKQKTDKQFLLKAFLPAFLLCLIAYTSRIPIVLSVIGPQVNNITYPFTKYVMRDFGMNALNVFNFSDLHLSNNYYTLSRNSVSDSWVLLPLSGEEGQRLKWHQSDRLYFGNSLGWRRNNIEKPHACELNQTDMGYLLELIKFDRNKNKVYSASYKIDYYYQDLPTIMTKNHYSFRVNPKKHICAIIYNPTLKSKVML